MRNKVDYTIFLNIKSASKLVEIKCVGYIISEIQYGLKNNITAPPGVDRMVTINNPKITGDLKFVIKIIF